MRDLFLLDPNVIFLNHGSFGACPKVVFERYQAWQLELERQPVEFLGRRYHDLMDEARAALAKYVNCAHENLIFVQNATAGLNVVARSLDLQPGDEILTTDHEYGALDLTWEFVCQQTGANYIHHTVPLPLPDDDTFVEHFWQSVTPNTKVIFLSHITSPTALTFPVAEICERARAAGIISIVDGAHVPGQLDLDLEAIGADFYSGNCHKWLCAPKGVALLYVNEKYHDIIKPGIISWGWLDDGTFVSRNQWQGTKDIAGYLTVPTAIEFQQEHNWSDIRQRCHQLAISTRDRINAHFGYPALTQSTDSFAQMSAFQVPDCDAVATQARLYAEHRVEVPFVLWNDKSFVRVSFQGYNTQADADALVEGLKAIFRE